jgi:hypothetical protein
MKTPKLQLPPPRSRKFCGLPVIDQANGTIIHIVLRRDLAGIDVIAW